MLRDSSNDIGTAVRSLMPDADTRDRAAYLLAVRLADEIDKSSDRMTLQFLAPTLLSALGALQATPKSRSVAKSSTEERADATQNPLSQLRAVHTQGLH
jgi:hypothetical protein